MINFDWFSEGYHKIKEAFRRLVERSSDLRPMWPKIAAVFYEAERGQFNSLGARGSGGWEPLSPLYQKWKSQYFPGEPLMRRTGDLYRSLTERNATNAIYEETPETLTLGTRDPKARFHQYGTHKMPQRPVMALIESDFRRIESIAGSEYQRVVEGLGFEVGGTSV